MNTAVDHPKHFTAGKLKLEIYPDAESAGEAAAQAAAAAVTEQLGRARESISVIFATGASQLKMLRALTSMSSLPWGKIGGFHMDEYVGISPDHPASFRRYLREKLTQRVRLQEFTEIEGDAEDPDAVCAAYGMKLHEANPQICLLGIGENGHLAFNDPGEADFEDSRTVKVVNLDAQCKGQQVAEGWFRSLEEVPGRAISLTVPTLFRVPKLLISVPGSRKAEIVRRTVEDPISVHCPSTILRTHPDATVYLDRESAARLNLAAYLG